MSTWVRQPTHGHFKLAPGTVSILVGCALLLPLVVFAIAPSVFAPYGQLEMHTRERFQPPSRQYLFGTDALGRDVFSRVVFGARASLLAAAATITLASVLGTSIGMVAGYVGGWLDEALMRLVDLVLAFPAFLLAIALASAAGPGIRNSMIAIAAVWWPSYARLVRGVTLSLKHRPFVEAAVVIGGGSLHIVRRHIVPNVATPVIVRMTLDLAYAVLLLAGLGFVGLGEPPPFPEWGSMVSTSRQYFLTYWWPGLFPGIALFLAALGVAFVGDGLTDRLDPRIRRY